MFSPASMARQTLNVSLAPSCSSSTSTVSSIVSGGSITGQPNVVAAIPNINNLQPIITALQTLTNNRTSQAQSLKKFNVNTKIINPDKKSIYETYVLRMVGSSNISTPQQLRQQILKQFGEKLVSSKLDFPVGYMKAGSKVWICSDADITDVWSLISKGDAITFWCHGIGKSSADPIFDDEDDNGNVDIRKPKRKKSKVTCLEEKNERIDELVCKLREKHGDLYNGIQYRLWAEMLDVGTYK